MIPDPPGTGGIVSKTGELGTAVGCVPEFELPNKTPNNNPTDRESFELSTGKSRGLKIGLVKQASRKRKQAKIRKPIETIRNVGIGCPDRKGGRKDFDRSFIVSLAPSPSIRQAIFAAYSDIA
ncbi:hypothetical protein [Leptospira inadai]|nr:hypothetical protein [Leptospira inadai]